MSKFESWQLWTFLRGSFCGRWPRTAGKTWSPFSEDGPGSTKPGFGVAGHPGAPPETADKPSALDDFRRKDDQGLTIQGVLLRAPAQRPSLELQAAESVVAGCGPVAM